MNEEMESVVETSKTAEDIETTNESNEEISEGTEETTETTVEGIEETAETTEIESEESMETTETIIVSADSNYLDDNLNDLTFNSLALCVVILLLGILCIGGFRYDY